jgi:PKD repeat protein
MVRRVLLLIFAIALASCAGSAPAPEPSALTLAEALAQLDALPTPDGVDGGTFSELKSALAASLRASGKSRFVSALPDGDWTLVDDLSVANANATEITLDWTYYNRGDYDQNSEANIADLTPLGVNLFKRAGVDADWDTKAMAADGNEDGEVNVSDITPLGGNLFGNVDGYIIEFNIDPGQADPWSELDRVDFAEGGLETGSPFLRFSIALTKPSVLTHYRVRAFSGVEVGPTSNVVTFDVGEPPVANSVSPTQGDEGFPATFIVDTSGGGVPTSFSWNFGGGATPNTSSDESPMVTLGPDGTYNASVTVGNSSGSDTVNFTLTVVNVNSVHIDSVAPTSGEENETVQLVPTFTGAPDTWLWEIGQAATPSLSLEQSPTVTLRLPGDYTVNVTATDSLNGDSDTFSFTLTITASSAPPVIEDVPNAGGVPGGQITMTATLSGTPPDTYAWDFGGGATPNTSTEESPTITLGAVGQYNASLIVTNANGSDTFDFILDVLAPPVITQGSHSPQTGNGGETVTFSIDVTGGTVTTWEWDFSNPSGDPMLQTAPYIFNEESPTVTLFDPGGSPFIGFVKVTVSNAAGSDSSTFPFAIQSM